MKKQIIAIGGGALSKLSKSFPIEGYILKQTNKEKPTVCFMATATDDENHNIAHFYDVFSNFSCERTHLALFNPPEDIEGLLMKQDVVYVGGGNTKNLLEAWRKWNLDKILFKAYRNGTLLTGFSAGSICWFEEGLSDYIPSGLNLIKALGYLKGSHCPHYDSEPNRKPRYHELIRSGVMKEGVAVEDDVALHYIDGHLKHIVSANSRGKAYQIKRNEEGTQEIVLKPTIYV